jgi:hypothetical protein
MTAVEPNLDRFNDDAFRYMDRIIPRIDYEREPSCEECGKQLSFEELKRSQRLCRECRVESGGDDE